jgi:hypothetical protein
MPRVMLLGAGRSTARGGAIWRVAAERLMIGGRVNELACVGSDRMIGEDREGVKLLGASKRGDAIGVGAENDRGCTCDGAALRGGGLELPREDRSPAAIPLLAKIRATTTAPQRLI